MYTYIHKYVFVSNIYASYTEHIYTIFKLSQYFAQSMCIRQDKLLKGTVQRDGLG